MFKSVNAQFRKPDGFLGGIISGLMQIGNKRPYEKIFPLLDLKPGLKILEIGYGPGIGIEILRKKTTDCKIHGIDFSKLMYEKASKKHSEYIKQGIINLKYGDFLTEEINDEKYDRVFCNNVIYFWLDLIKPFKKVNSILNPGGIYCIFMIKFKNKIDKHNIFNIHSIEEVVEKLKSAGFSNVEYKFDHGYYIRAGK